VRIFISYARTYADTALAQYLTRRFLAIGIDVWQLESLPANEPLQAGVENAILESDHAIFLISKLWLSRDLTWFELARFHQRDPRDTRLIPVFRLPRAQLNVPPPLINLKGVTWLETEPDPDARFWEVYCGITNTEPGPVDAWGARGRELTKAPVRPPERGAGRAAVDVAASARPRGNGLFICYRRQHAEGYAGRIFDRLATELPVTRLFMDVDNIQPGEDFVEAIEAAISGSRVMLVLITREWADARDGTGTRLIDRSDDFVRLEIGRALAGRLVVIPVLVGGAPSPRDEELPQELRPLSRRQTIELRHPSWRDDMNKLVQAVQKLLT
jgi:hypothetical protein